jgi:hypothetical protein
VRDLKRKIKKGKGVTMENRFLFRGIAIRNPDLVSKFEEDNDNE